MSISTKNLKTDLLDNVSVVLINNFYTLEMCIPVFVIYQAFFNYPIEAVPFGLFTYFLKNRVSLHPCWSWPQACASPVSSFHVLGLKTLCHHVWTYSNSHAPHSTNLNWVVWVHLYTVISFTDGPSGQQSVCLFSIPSILMPSKKLGMYSVLNNYLFSNVTELATVHSLGVRLLFHIKQRYFGMNWLLS